MITDEKHFELIGGVYPNEKLEKDYPRGDFSKLKHVTHEGKTSLARHVRVFKNPLQLASYYETHKDVQLIVFVKEQLKKLEKYGIFLPEFSLIAESRQRISDKDGDDFTVLDTEKHDFQRFGNPFLQAYQNKRQLYSIPVVNAIVEEIDGDLFYMLFREKNMEVKTKIIDVCFQILMGLGNYLFDRLQNGEPIMDEVFAWRQFQLTPQNKPIMFDIEPRIFHREQENNPLLLEKYREYSLNCLSLLSDMKTEFMRRFAELLQQELYQEKLQKFDDLLLKINHLLQVQYQQK